ncbi:MAG: hypothetical protein EOP35_04160 [Rubrivivax sp.]|nr:MAG: hypothetical protein EOP35_04160 [Rubrivivax sp.]
MAQLAYFVGFAWMAWCLFNVALLFASPYLVGDRTVVTNGFTVRIPDAVREMVTEAELAALMAHEEGHIAHEHALKNLCRACIFLRRSPKMAMLQEIEADQYAADRGHAVALASALRKLSGDAFDLYRASRLDPR